MNRQIAANNQAAAFSSTILRRIAEQDKSAIVECLDTYGKLVWALARKFTKTTEDAEDAVQDVFIDIWKYAGRFDQTKSPEGAFVTLIARRRLIDRMRKENRQPQIAFYDDALKNQSSDADKKLQMYVELRSALDALNKLSQQQKQILQMAIYGGMSHTEIAETTGLPLGTIKSQIRRIFQKLRSSV